MTITEPALRLVKWFSEIGIEDVPSVGGKNASLGEMRRALSAAGVPVPDGFAITAQAYRGFIEASGLKGRVVRRPGGSEELRRFGREAREAILGAEFPAALRREIWAAYERLGEGKDVDVAVRSSATAEDLPDASFAGQQETFLNVRGRAALLDACRRCFASLFTDRAISYRADMGIDET
ncbi:MAG: phosphoenolpyruvate synthase, partial [Elusimicrobia bacterium]|nr:phosphoenolpyruvate synthase [Elusimicrobiota bacterium]